jgi:hypothetical protein
MNSAMSYKSKIQLSRLQFLSTILIGSCIFAVQAAPVNIPPQEENFIKIISQAQTDAKNADNDMQKGGIKVRRDKSICTLMPNKAVKNWVGKVNKVGANSDGKGVLVVTLAKGITLKTWNNEFSDMSSKTLIDPNSKLFQNASMLKKGDSITFSGTFLPGKDGECIYEGSVSLSGKLRDPEFIFRFSSVSAN